MKVALFITCLTDTFYPRAGIAMVKVLEHLGHEVVFPEEQTCCGQPMYNNGFHDEARTLAARMVDLFASYEAIVTPSGSCAAMVRSHFPTLFPPGSRERKDARALGEKTYEFAEFLVRVLDLDLASLSPKWDGVVTYHYSCHLRDLGVTDEAIRLMQGVEGLAHTPLPMADQCCGFGGTFALKYPQISGNMVHDKVEGIRETGADTVICNDAGCSMNISGACRRENIDVGFTTLAEVIAEGLGLLERVTP